MQSSACELFAALHAIVAAAGGTGEAPLAKGSELGVLARIAAARAAQNATKRSTLVARLELAAVATRVAANAEDAVAGVAGRAAGESTVAAAATAC